MNLKQIAAGIACTIATLPVMAQNSSEQVVAHTEEMPAQNKYGRNLITVAPIQLSENGVAGVGLSYERSLDRQGIVALSVPVSMVMSTNSESRVGVQVNDPMYYIMPGLKIYPTGNKGVVKYALGPSIVFATGERTERDDMVYFYNYTYYGYAPYNNFNYNPVETRKHTMLGMMMNQSLNISPTPHLYLGAEFGLGFTYLNRMDGVNRPTQTLTQFGFKLGYRF